MLLLDRAMSAVEPAAEGRLALGAAACLAAALRTSAAPPSGAALARATGFPEGLLAEMSAGVGASLGGDTATLSALRCLKLYLRRLGGQSSNGSTNAVHTNPFLYSGAGLYFTRAGGVSTASNGSKDAARLGSVSGVWTWSLVTS